MRIEFTRTRSGGPANQLAEAEVYFDADGPFCGLKLAGISVWAGPHGGRYATMPARAYGAGSERKYWDYLRSADPPDSAAGKSAVGRFKAWVSEEYKAWAVAQGIMPQEAVSIDDADVPF